MGDDPWQSPHCSSGASWAGTEELKFVVEVFVAGFFADFFFEIVNRAGGLDGFDAPAFGADQIVAVLAGEQKREICGALVKSQAADEAVVGKALEQPEDGGLVALIAEAAR